MGGRGPPERRAALPDRAEVAIVGGGYAGLSAALTLGRLGHAPVVLDAERIGWEASSRNGGMVSGGLKVAASALERRFGPERARRIALAAAASFPFLEATIAREGIACDYVRCGRFTPAWSPRHYDALAAQVERIAAITGLPAAMLPRARQREALGSDFYHGGMLVAATGSLHPGKYARGLADAAGRAGARLVDRVRVAAIREERGGFRLATDRGEMRADAVLVATNGYARGLGGASAMPWLARRLVPLASYIIATEPLGEGVVDRLFPGRRMIVDTRRILNYFPPRPTARACSGAGARASEAGTRSGRRPCCTRPWPRCSPS
ncbi:NAD(P)/FAD-dependent oxidoreductase [Caldovatus aquaticus]|uniref:NAD(P)/FAD-dependent oxidoreductase n=1 Tax=Caldovatus aquaticus TaxID=2865671 RepID=UPI0034E1D80F